jgi:hypothetical protein
VSERLAITLKRALLMATVLLLAAFVVAAFFNNEFRSRNWDPQQTKVYVDRTLRFGGTFYENGLLNKGPLEPMVYRIAAAITSADGFWFAISAFIIITNVFVAWSAGATTVALGGRRLLGFAVAVAVFYHFCLGKADYAGVLYARNMIVGLLATAWLIAVTPGNPLWRRPVLACTAMGLLVGLAMQTLYTSIFASAAVTLFAWFSLERLDDEVTYRRCRRALVIVPVATIVAPVLYYAVRGRLDEFWSGYVTYNVYQNEATGQSLAAQLVYGRDAILRYYRAWPVSLAIVVVFFLLTAALWRTMSRRDRMLHLAITLWFVGAWLELVLGQRYSSHYFAVLALPTCLMVAACAAHLHRFVVRERGELRSGAAWPLLAALLSVAAGGGGTITLGLEAASSFTSVSSLAAARDAVQPGQERTVRAVLDLVSTEDDPLLAWTEYPWTYLNFERVSATRWIWKSFMLGQVYLAHQNQAYVLPRTWEWFADDMEEADPQAFLEEVALPLTPGTPFADYVDANFTEVYAGQSYNVYLRNPAAAAVTAAAATPFTPVARETGSSLWAVAGDAASFTSPDVPALTDLLHLASTRCTRISGRYKLSGAADPFISFVFSDASGSAANVRLNIVGSQFLSGSDGAVFDTTKLPPPAEDDEPDETTTVPSTTGDQVAPADPLMATDPDESTAPPAAAADGGEHDFTVVVGQRSAALVVDGQIRAAVRLSGQQQLDMQVRAGAVELTDLRRGDPPPASGCGRG